MQHTQSCQFGGGCQRCHRPIPVGSFRWPDQPRRIMASYFLKDDALGSLDDHTELSHNTAHQIVIYAVDMVY